MQNLSQRDTSPIEKNTTDEVLELSEAELDAIVGGVKTKDDPPPPPPK